MRHVFASVYLCRWTNDTSSILVGQVAQQRHGSALQSVLRFFAWVLSMFPRSADEWLWLSVPVERVWSIQLSFSCLPANNEAGCTWFVLVCATDASFFFLLRLSLMRPSQNNGKKNIGVESKFAMSMLSFIHNDCVSFRWRGFSRGWLWVSLSFCHGECAMRTQAAQLISVAYSSSSAQCLL